MNPWNETPFVRLLLPFIAGILFAVYSGIHIEYLFWFILALLFVLLIFNSVKKLQISYQFRWLNGIIANILFFLLGIHLTIFKTDKFLPNHFSKFLLNDSSYAIIQLLEPTTEKEKSYKTIGQVKKIISSGKTIDCNGKVMIYLKKDGNSPLLRYGDLILVKNNFKEISPPQNPGEFDYRQYLSFHNIYHQAYLKPVDWKMLNINEGNAILKMTYKWREKFFLTLYKHFPTKHELAVGSALILGYMDYIDDQIIQTYSSTGAMHVLSVSGLHVGIIFQVLRILLKFLDKYRWGKIFKTILIVLCIWAFTLITGSASATVRAAVMLSCIVIGMTFQRTINIYNIIAFSAFAMLCYNPYFIMDVGFQLSYLAILGLVSLQPKIYNLMYVKNWVLDKIWAMTAVSFAAQIATFPLGLLYFHQFPNYFLISNIIVVPAAAIVLYVGILLLLFSPVIIVANFLGKLLYYSVFALNWLIFYIEKLPHALIQGLSINIFQTWLIYGLVISVIVLLLNKKPKYIFAGLTIGIFLAGANLYKSYFQFQQKKLIVYNIPKISAIELIDGNRNFFLSDSSLINDDNKMLFHIKHNWWENGIERTKLMSFGNFKLRGEKKFSDIFMNNSFILFHNKRIVFIRDKSQIQGKSSQLNTDFLILSGNPKIKISELLNCFKAKLLIIDSSNSDWKINQWLKECIELNVTCFSVKQQGAFEMNI